MRPPTTLDRRSALVVAASGVGIAFTAGCSTAGRSAPPTRTAVPSSTAGPGAGASPARRDVDPALRARAIADERRLLAACAAPAGQEPFATLRRVHQSHLRTLTKQSVAGPAAAPQLPVIAPLAAAERSAAVARRADCVRASASLAPLLASLAASSEVAAALLSR